MRFGLKQRFGFSDTGGGGATPPVFTVAPVVSGTAVVGQTLTCDGGTVTGTPTPTKTYQWYRGATLISGATNSTYTLVQADAGNASNIKCVVDATNSAGSASADSNTIAQVLDANLKAVIDRATTLGYTLPSSSGISKLNTTIIQLKSIGGFQRGDVLYFAGQDGSAGFGTLNYIDPTKHQMTLFNSPSWTSNVGFIGTGTQYIDLNYNPATQAVNFAAGNSTKLGFVPTNSAFVQSASFFGSNTPVYTRLLRGSSVSTNSYAQSATAFILDMSGTGTKAILRNAANLVTVVNNATVSESTDPNSPVIDSASETIFRERGTITAGKIGIAFMGSSIKDILPAFRTALDDYYASL